MQQTHNDVVIVTGACGGMGAAIARSFAEEGHALILSDLREEPLENLAKSLRDDAEISLIAGDIADTSLPGQIIAALGTRKIGALVHAAGVSPSMADGRRIVDINLFATRRLVEAVLPAMAPDGAAILIASNSGHLLARPMLDKAIRNLLAGRRSLISNLLMRSSRTAYPLSKRGVQLYAQSMAPRFGAVGARIVSLSPGIIDTPMGALENNAGPEMARMIDVTPAGRTGRPEEIAAVVSFLASSSASYITGTDILVDGGSVAGVHQAGGVRVLQNQRRER
ncbi:oxidoreductase [Novosphingobium endophyticum]|uniref:Oxidoreductase n=2 Tax=Novosphingobium endophyticum TaxID=1955250 RepID=A0A916TSF8_9SPHN|nr:oxidoreductase [Novosphingobium endophyticum]